MVLVVLVVGEVHWRKEVMVVEVEELCGDLYLTSRHSDTWK